MLEPDHAHSSGAQRRFLTFRIDERLYALPADEVSEVIRIPPVASIPLSPRSLLGLANLRGSVLPVASLRRLLGQDTAESASKCAIVLEGAAPVALTVDVVRALVSITPERVETRQTELSAEPGEQLRGAFAADADQNIAKILDIQPLLAAAFAPRARAPKRARTDLSREPLHESPATAAEYQKLVTFGIVNQEYAFELDAVHEIIGAPKTFAADPKSESLVLGVSAYRDTLLPLLSLRGLLGFAPADISDGREKVVVLAVGGVLVGLLVDRMCSVIAAAPNLLEPPSALITARAGGETQLKAIYRGDEGRRLVSVLSPEKLFREDVMQRLGAGRKAEENKPDEVASTGQKLKFLVFRLGDEEFALPIGAVDEVAQVPDQITRLPKTPAFLEGVVNLRGEVLPVVDQRRRFDMPILTERHRRRLIVVRTERHRASLIVDSVSEVLNCREDAIEPAPDLTGETTQLVFGVINLAGRIVLLLDPGELLSQAERGLLDSFAQDHDIQNHET
jgi:purine-binding chemotaxis protein CheW